MNDIHDSDNPIITGRNMNWDWEKLREQQQRYKKSQGGGGIGGDGPPPMDDILDQFKKFKMPGGFLIVLVIAFFLGATMIYTIKSNEVGIVQRFGRFVRKTQPGLHIKLPIGIEKLTKIKTDKIYTEEFGYTGGDVNEVTLMLTGDLNVALVPWLVQYQISKPEKYLFKVHAPENLLRDLAQASMRLVVGDRSIDEVIIKRDEIANACKEILQKELDLAETGLKVVTIEMKKTNVPEPVQPSFNEVNKAQQEKETMIYKANEEYNKAIPAALGEAQRTVLEAEGYALDAINRAEGDAARFMAMYKEYAKAKDVTSRRIYLEKMGELLPKIGRKYIVDSKQKNILPLLNMGLPVKPEGETTK
jgi:membrane protease subunit HflK